MQWYLDALPFAPRQLDKGDEQESHNQDADISAVQVQDTYRQLLVPSCRHESAHDPPPSTSGGFGKLVSTVPSSRSFLHFGLRQVGDAVFIACFFAFLFFEISHLLSHRVWWHQRWQR